ncbi:MAG: hypothetical protein NW203_15110 [Hyphomonadaceae bacterium]|nr:hypothetical protein [Hyphomonadaceae bacterium]
MIVAAAAAAAILTCATFVVLFAARDAIRRLGAAVLGLAGATALAAALGAPAAGVVTLAAAFAAAPLGALLMVRIREAYGSVALHEIDAADQDAP